MKTKIAFATTAILVVFTSLLLAQNVKYGHFVKTVADTGTPEAITSTNLKCSSVTLLGIKAARTANAGTVYVGWTSANDSQFFPITASGEIVINAGDGRTINLAEIYVDVLNNGDGVGVYYK